VPPLFFLFSAFLSVSVSLPLSLSLTRSCRARPTGWPLYWVVRERCAGYGSEQCVLRERGELRGNGRLFLSPAGLEV